MTIAGFPHDAYRLCVCVCTLISYYARSQRCFVFEECLSRCGADCVCSIESSKNLKLSFATNALVICAYDIHNQQKKEINNERKNTQKGGKKNNKIAPRERERENEKERTEKKNKLLIECTAFHIFAFTNLLIYSIMSTYLPIESSFFDVNLDHISSHNSNGTGFCILYKFYH